MAEQLALFTNPRAPHGLDYAAEFISSSVEQELIAHVASLPLEPFQFGQYEGKRRVASFGWRYDYSLRRLLLADAIPRWLNPLIERVQAFGGSGTNIAQILCTEYEAGVGIGWHRDKPHFDKIFGVSLESPCKLRFRKPKGEAWERFTLEVAPRSIYKMSEEVRFDWEHSIPEVEGRRYSITLRTLKENSDIISSDSSA